MTEDQAQDALAQTNLAFGKSIGRSSARPSRRARSSAPPPWPAPRSSPDATVDLVLSKGRKPIEIKDWTGKDVDDAERGPGEAQARGRR